MDRGELMILVGGKRRSLLMAGDDNEVYGKEHQRYAKADIIVCSGKS